MKEVEETLKRLQQQLDTQQAQITLIHQTLEKVLEKLEHHQMPNYDEEFGNLYSLTKSLSDEISALKKTSLLNQPQEILNRIERASEDKVKRVAESIEEANRNADQINAKLASLVTNAQAKIKSGSIFFTFGFGVILGFGVPYLLSYFS